MLHVLSTMTRRVRVSRLAILLVLFGLQAAQPARAFLGYDQTNLVSNIPGLAKFTDPGMINPWGMSSSATSPIWVSDNGSDLSTLYNGAGAKQGLVVSFAAQSGSPTGQVFNSGSDFKANRFIFAGEDGTISGWRGALGTNAETDAIVSGAVYKGLAMGTSGALNYLYAANFHDGRIDVFDGNYNPTLFATPFTDPTLPSGYAPFNIQNIGGKLYVTYALQDAAKHDDVGGAGHGFVDVFNTDGSFVQRLVSQGSLDSPWGLALAPGDFGDFSNDLLVGNFGDGTINAYDPLTGASQGQMLDGKGNALHIDGLWGLMFGNGGNGGAKNEMYFTAGINGEQDGLFGKLSAVPEPNTGILMLMGMASLVLIVKKNRS